MILSFQNRFEEPIIKGTKIHTFRLDPHDRWKVGMPIQFYVNARTKQMRKFREDGECTLIQRVEIKGVQSSQNFKVLVFWGDGKYCVNATKLFAKLDGFKSVAEFRECLKLLHPNTWALEGKVIHWTDFRY